MLALTTLVWGLSFPLMKHWQLGAAACPGGDLVASHTLMGLRMLLGLAVLACLRPRLFLLPTWREFRIGMVFGLLNFTGLTCQMLGLAQTTPALSGFFTSLAGAWVPLLAFALFRRPVSRPMLWGLLVCLVGAAVLGIDPDQPWMIGGGELWTLLSTFVFATFILLLDRWGRAVQSSHLTVAIILFTGLPAVPLAALVAGHEASTAAWLSWLVTTLREPAALGAVLLLASLCTVCATLWMATYQPRVPAARAALIYFLEPVFAALFSVGFGYDVISLSLVLGGALILLGNLLVELPLWAGAFPARGPESLANGESEGRSFSS